MGYIKDFWEKIDNGKAWDKTIERKAGGVKVTEAITIDQCTLCLSSLSSVMSLIRATVGQFIRTNTVDEQLLSNFLSIRVTWLLESDVHEIGVLNISENLEQATRKKHTELDNLFQVKAWMEAMQLTTSETGLDPAKTLDIFKYAVALGNPTKPMEVDVWMKALLQGKPPTFENKLSMMSKASVNKKFLENNKVMIKHPQLRVYKDIVLRVRAVRGFHELPLLHKLIIEQMARKGLASRQCPVTSNLLLDPNILTSEGFFSPAEKEQVPPWRDGALGHQIQRAMCEVAEARAFQWKQIDSPSCKSLFATGANWSAFARLCGPPHFHMDSAMEHLFKSKTSWNDSVKSLHRGIWTGDHDSDIMKLAAVIPAVLDNQGVNMQKRLCELFPPFRPLLLAQQADSQKMVTEVEKKYSRIKKWSSRIKKNSFR